MLPVRLNTQKVRRFIEPLTAIMTATDDDNQDITIKPLAELHSISIPDNSFDNLDRQPQVLSQRSLTYPFHNVPSIDESECHVNNLTHI